MRRIVYQSKEKLVLYADPNMPMRRNDPDRRRAFLERHNCDKKKDPFAPGFWSCLEWSRPDEKCTDCE